MSLTDKYNLMANFIKNVPFVKKRLECEYEEKFSGDCYGCFRGVFENFEQALASAPKTKKIGFNVPEFADEFKVRLTRIFPYDYPVLFWMSSLLKNNIKIFDLGGHIGLHYYAYDKYLQYPANMQWTVCDVPEITNSGNKLASARKIPNLFFTNNFSDADCTNILIAAGSIQYIETPLAELLSGLTRKPRHLLLNKMPLYKGKQFATLQNGGVAFIPQYVFNKDDFINSICKLGYQMIDIWEDHVHSCIIPFHPKNSINIYSGMYFKKILLDG